MESKLLTPDMVRERISELEEDLNRSYTGMSSPAYMAITHLREIVIDQNFLIENLCQRVADLEKNAEQKIAEFTAGLDPAMNQAIADMVEKLAPEVKAMFDRYLTESSNPVLEQMKSLLEMVRRLNGLKSPGRAGH